METGPLGERLKDPAFFKAFSMAALAFECGEVSISQACEFLEMAPADFMKEKNLLAKAAGETLREMLASMKP